MDNEELLQQSLKENLRLIKEEGMKRIPEEMLEKMSSATEALKAYDYKDKTLQVGDVFPDGILYDFNLNELHVHELLKDKLTIINFYRGSWCPYCNLELRYYNELLSIKENKDVHLIAISPEKPDVTFSNEDMKGLRFEVLSDLNNALAKKLNLVFELPEDIQKIYNEFGINLADSQGNREFNLPVPATFIIDEKGKVAYVDLDVDYTTRPEATEVIRIYKTLK